MKKKIQEIATVDTNFGTLDDKMSPAAKGKCVEKEAALQLNSPDKELAFEVQG